MQTCPEKALSQGKDTCFLFLKSLRCQAWGGERWAEVHRAQSQCPCCPAVIINSIPFTLSSELAGKVKWMATLGMEKEMPPSKERSVWVLKQQKGRRRSKNLGAH